MVYGILIVFICIALIFMSIRRVKNEKSEVQKLEEQIEDEYLYDPSSGAKITLEQAESGKWPVDTISKEEFNDYLNKCDSVEEKEEKSAINYLTKEKSYDEITLSEGIINLLNDSAILSKNKNWKYSDAYLFNNKSTFILISVDSYMSTELLMIININNIDGHYYLREKSVVEKVFDAFRNDDELSLDNYESFTFRKAKSIESVNKVLLQLKGQQQLEIELDNDILLLKTIKHINIGDIKRFENISNCFHQ